MTDCDGVPLEHDAVPSYLGELEVQCVAEPETYVDWKLPREDAIAAFLKHFPSSVKENPCSNRSQAEKILYHHKVTRSRQSKD